MFALLAAGAWFRAATFPVAVDGPPAWMDDELLKKIQARGQLILRGAQWNRRAAFLAGMSALTSAISWALPFVLK
jgi:hypothetical protein